MGILESNETGTVSPLLDILILFGPSITSFVMFIRRKK